jgi:hypothetical protein
LQLLTTSRHRSFSILMDNQFTIVHRTHLGTQITTSSLSTIDRQL